MAGRQRTLTPKQRAALDAVVKQKAHYESERALIRSRIEEEVAREIASLETALSLAVRRAREVGVPMVRIGREGLGTTSPNTPVRWLRMTDSLAEAESASIPPFRLMGDGSIEVRLEEWDTAALGADDYPKVLTGVVRRDSSQESGWAVVTDPQTKQTELGDLPGWLTWEIERSPSAPKSLTAALNEWDEEL